MVVDGHVNELPPLLAGAERALASDPMAHSIEAAKPFDVNVKQLAGAFTFVPANGRRRIDVGEPASFRSPGAAPRRPARNPPPACLWSRRSKRFALQRHYPREVAIWT